MSTTKIESDKIPFNPEMPLMPQMLHHLTREEIDSLAVKQLERQGRAAMRNIRKSDNQVQDVERLASAVFHSVKKLMPAERAIAFSCQVWDELHVDTRDTKYVTQASPITMEYFHYYASVRMQ